MVPQELIQVDFGPEEKQKIKLQNDIHFVLYFHRPVAETAV
jgi:hypothetical protein